MNPKAATSAERGGGNHDSNKSGLSGFVAQPHAEADWATVDWVASHTEGATEPLVPNANQRGGGGGGSSGAASGEGGRRLLPPHVESFLAALLCGLALGGLGVFCDACASWVSNFRLGICAEFFWLGRAMCCVDAAECPEYYTWGEFFLGRGSQATAFIEFVMYVTYSTLGAVVASFLCKVYAPYASGGGISEVKTIVSGHHQKRYLGGWTLMTKSVGMCFSTGSGLVVGKEGPFVHIGACVGDLVASLFPGYQLESRKRELITAGAGGGMAVAFGAPVGGVIFALEEVSVVYNFKALMAALICGVTAVLVTKRVDLWHNGRIVQFSVNYQHNWHFFELPLFAAIGIFGGFLGSAFSMANLHVSRWRKRNLKQWRMGEVAAVAAVTAVVNYLMPYSSGSLLELLGDCFQDCTPESEIEMCHGGEAKIFLSLVAAATAKLVLFMYTVGIFLPAGILVPSLAIGALYGRGFGILFRAIQEAYADSYVFSECSGQDLCVIPGVYAIVGAAAMLTGVTRMTICLVIIMFELTGSLEYMVPVTISILCAKMGGEALGVDGTYEIGIEESNLPYLDPKKEFHLDFVAEDVCAKKRFTVLTAYGLKIKNINELLRHMNVTGFPVVASAEDTTLLGYAPTKKIVRALQLAAAHDSNVSLDTYVRFREQPSISSDPDFLELDLSGIMEACMLQVEPDCSVKKVLYLFHSLGAHHVVVCRYAKFEGLISKKDIIDFMRAKEREEHVADAVLEKEAAQRRSRHHQQQQQQQQDDSNAQGGAEDCGDGELRHRHNPA